MPYVKVKLNGRKRVFYTLCWECTGAGLMAGNYPCKVCRGTGKIKITPLGWHLVTFHS